MSMHLCRKINASWLIRYGVDATTVDMLQGRCPASILARHYQAPDNTLKQRVMECVDKLMVEVVAPPRVRK